MRYRFNLFNKYLSNVNEKLISDELFKKGFAVVVTKSEHLSINDDDLDEDKKREEDKDVEKESEESNDKEEIDNQEEKVLEEDLKPKNVFVNDSDYESPDEETINQKVDNKIFILPKNNYKTNIPSTPFLIDLHANYIWNS